MKYQITMKSKKEIEFTSEYSLEKIRNILIHNDYFDVGVGVTVLTGLIEFVEEVE